MYDVLSFEHVMFIEIYNAKNSVLSFFLLTYIVHVFELSKTNSFYSLGMQTDFTVRLCDKEFHNTPFSDT